MIEREPTLEDAMYVAIRLKESDRRELAEYGLGFDELVNFPEWAERPGSRIWEAGGVPVALGGIDGSQPWLFTTDDIRLHRATAHRMAKEKIAKWVAERGAIWNYVSVANQDSIDWLMALGANFHGHAHRFSPTGGLFVKFSWGE